MTAQPEYEASTWAHAARSVQDEYEVVYLSVLQSGWCLVLVCLRGIVAFCVHLHIGSCIAAQGIQDEYGRHMANLVVSIFQPDAENETHPTSLQ